MAGEWRVCTISEIKADDDRAIAIGPFGSRMKADKYVAEGVPVIRGNNISDTRVLVGDLVFVSEETADELRACNVFPGDLVFPHRGAIGQVGIVPNEERGRYVLSTSLMKLTCNQALVDPLFIFYFFRSEQGRHALLQNASTVGTPGIGQPLSSLRSRRQKGIAEGRGLKSLRFGNTRPAPILLLRSKTTVGERGAEPNP
jgi:type I restriction enzyme S subunit